MESKPETKIPTQALHRATGKTVSRQMRPAERLLREQGQVTMTDQYNPTQLIAPDVRLGKNVRIFDFVNLYGCQIGDGSKIGTFVEIQKRAKIGKKCKISSHTFICEGVTIQDEVFVGHGVTFTNDLFPRAVNEDGSIQTDDDWSCITTTVEKGASIGSGATLLCGITIGEGALIGAGSVVTKDVPSQTVVVGNPAKVIKTLPS